jgi:prophage regulatory protein
MRRSPYWAATEDRGTTPDLFEQLKVDPGRRTLGELLQERDWAVQEIARLRAVIVRLESRPVRTVSPIPIGRDAPELGAGSTTWMELRRLLRLSEVCSLIGLSRAAIYQMKTEGRFPAPVKVGVRAVRWRMADIVAWQEARSA